MSKENDYADVIIPIPKKKRAGVVITLENERSKSITADDDTDYRAQMEELKKTPCFIKGNYIEVKKIVGVLIPIKTEEL